MALHFKSLGEAVGVGCLLKVSATSGEQVPAASEEAVRKQAGIRHAMCVLGKLPFTTVSFFYCSARRGLVSLSASL